MRQLLEQGKSYIFSDFFAMPQAAAEIAAACGYQLVIQNIILPRWHLLDSATVQQLQNDFYTVLPRINFNSEAAKREFMIAPLLFVIAKIADANIHLEYPLRVDDMDIFSGGLSGVLDYFICSVGTPHELIVIEAKKGDMERGFNQLLAELAALDRYEHSCCNHIYGAITIGELWRFCLLDRQKKIVYRDLHNFTLPENTGDILAILLGILMNPTQDTRHIQELLHV